MAPCMRKTIILIWNRWDEDSGWVAIATAPCMRHTLILIWNKWDGDIGWVAIAMAPFMRQTLILMMHECMQIRLSPKLLSLKLVFLASSTSREIYFTAMTSRAAAVKSCARPLKRAEAEPEEGAESAAKQAKYTDGGLKSQCKGYFQRLANGSAQKAGADQVNEAKEALSTFEALEEEDKVKFAKAFYSNKGTKTFGFVKDYSEKMKSSKTSEQSVSENYFTRIASVNVRTKMHEEVVLSSNE